MSPFLEVSRRFPASALRIEHEGTELVLRALAVTDAQGIVTAIEESLVDLRRFMPWSHVPQTYEVQVERIRRSITHSMEGSDFMLGLFVASSNRYLVGCGFHPRTPLNPKSALEIGYWTRSAESGRGLATLTTRLLIVYALEGLAVDRVQIVHNADNEASRRVIEKCGFQREGVVRNMMPAPAPALIEKGYSSCRDAIQYSLLPEDRSSLPWYAPLRDRVHVTNQVGEDLGFHWRT